MKIGLIGAGSQGNALAKQCALHIVMERYSLDEDFESKVARMIDLKIKLKRFGLEDNEYNELDELQDWFTWGKWRNG